MTNPILLTQLAEAHSNWSVSAVRLSRVEKDLERARLVAETTLGCEAMARAEREWLRANRPPLAERWNVLTTLKSEQLSYVA